MSFLRKYRFALLFLALTVVCCVQVTRQMEANYTRHFETREAFVLLWEQGHRMPAERLYHRLITNLERLPDRALLDDVQRFKSLVDPKVEQTDNLIWRYYWAVAQEQQSRLEQNLSRAVTLAGTD